MTTDMVNHPTHYTSHKSGVECIVFSRYLPASLANTFKYVWRCGEKGNPVQDLQKALWYLRDYKNYPVGITEDAANELGLGLVVHEEGFNREVLQDSVLLTIIGIATVPEAYKYDLLSLAEHRLSSLIKHYEGLSP